MAGRFWSASTNRCRREREFGDSVIQNSKCKMQTLRGSKRWRVLRNDTHLVVGSLIQNSKCKHYVSRDVRAYYATTPTSLSNHKFKIQNANTTWVGTLGRTTQRHPPRCRLTNSKFKMQTLRKSRRWGVLRNDTHLVISTN